MKYRALHEKKKGGAAIGAVVIAGGVYGVAEDGTVEIPDELVAVADEHWALERAGGTGGGPVADAD